MEEITIENNYSFSEKPIRDFVEIVLAGGEPADMAMYYLLHHRLALSLKKRFQPFSGQLLDDFDDVVDDFFIYLREGEKPQNNADNSGSATPETNRYQSLMSIKKPESFEPWLMNTFRNYLSNRALKMRNYLFLSSDNETLNYGGNREPGTESQEPLINDERALQLSSLLIAYTLQVLQPREAFIFMRSLLSLLNKQRAVPNAEMAQALGMTDVAYRVTLHRVKCRLAEYRDILLDDKSLNLDAVHLKMAQQINDDFDHLYPTLKSYYNEIIETLECRDEVLNLLRKKHDEMGGAVHDSTTALAIPATTLCKRLMRLMIV